MKLTEDLIRECFGPDDAIDPRFPLSGYRIKTRTGGTAIVTERGFKKIVGGTDLDRKSVV